MFIIGAGGFGREVLALINQLSPSMQLGAPSAFIDDNIAPGTLVNGLPVLGGLAVLKQHEGASLVIAIGNGATRKKITAQLDCAKFEFPNVIHPNVILDDPKRIKMGKGNIIAAGNILTTDILMGNFCVVNLQCTIGHDAVLEDFTSLMPGVHISGGAKIRTGVFIGTGANLIKATEVGAFTIVGAGAMVDKDLPPHVTAAGVPCKILRNNV